MDAGECIHERLRRPTQQGEATHDAIAVACRPSLHQGRLAINPTKQDQGFLVVALRPREQRSASIAERRQVTADQRPQIGRVEFRRIQFRHRAAHDDRCLVQIWRIARQGRSQRRAGHRRLDAVAHRLDLGSNRCRRLFTGGVAAINGRLLRGYQPRLPTEKGGCGQQYGCRDQSAERAPVGSARSQRRTAGCIRLFRAPLHHPALIAPCCRNRPCRAHWRQIPRPRRTLPGAPAQLPTAQPVRRDGS